MYLCFATFSSFTKCEEDEFFLLIENIDEKCVFNNWFRKEDLKGIYGKRTLYEQFWKQLSLDNDGYGFFFLS